MKIAFCWDWEPYLPQVVSWQDGLARALKELNDRGHEVAVIMPGPEFCIVKHPYFNITITPDVPKLVKILKPDVILCWADMTRPNAKPLRELGIPMAICFAGGEPNNYNTYDFDHVFVESEVYRQRFEELQVPVSIAFGCNSELFQPIAGQVKIFDTIFPATFAAWKRHSLYAQAVQGFKALAVGHMYTDHEQECWEECLRLGVNVMPYVSGEALRYLYGASKVCVVTSQSNGGSQRTVLEALSMNLPLIVTDSDKFDYIHGYAFEAEPDAQEIRMMVEAILDGEPDVDTRSYILDNWSYVQYADALEKGLKSIA